MYRRCIAVCLCIILTGLSLFAETFVARAWPESLTSTLHCAASPTQDISSGTEDNALLSSLVVVQNREKIGSGVFISNNGYLLTAGHVVTSSPTVAIYLYNGDTLTGHVLQHDPIHDIALVKVEGEHFNCRPLQTKQAQVGDAVLGLGLSMDAFRLTYQITPATIVSNHVPNADWLLINANLPIGHSGGPLLNQHGEVVGLISRKEEDAQHRIRTYGSSAMAIQKSVYALLPNQSTVKPMRT